MPEVAEAQTGVTESPPAREPDRPDAQRAGALSAADFERLVQRVYRLAAAETRLSSARGQRLPQRRRPGFAR